MSNLEMPEFKPLDIACALEIDNQRHWKCVSFSQCRRVDLFMPMFNESLQRHGCKGFPETFDSGPPNPPRDLSNPTINST